MYKLTKHWKILEQLLPHILDRIDTFLVRNIGLEQSLLVVTKNGLGYYWYGSKAMQLRIPSLASMVAQADNYLVFLTRNGQLYELEAEKLQQIATLTSVDQKTDIISPNWIDCHRKFVSVRCGKYHCVGLTDQGKLYSISNGQPSTTNQKIHFSPVKISMPNTDPMFVEIACGAYHSVALTENGDILTWGKNDAWQLGRPNDANLNQLIDLDFKVKSVAAGKSITIVLSTEGEVYVCGSISTDFVSVEFIKVVGLPVIDQIASHCNHNLAIAMTVDRTCYAWGEFNTDVTHLEPGKLPPEYSTLDSVLSHYGHDTPHSISIHDYPNCGSNPLYNRMSRMLDNPTTSDIQFVLGSKTIYAHRCILVNFSSYFEVMLSERWIPPVDSDDSIFKVPINEYSYEVFYAFLHYIYTQSLNCEPDYLMELYELASCFMEPELEQLCLSKMQISINIGNCCQFYQFAKRFELVKFKQYLDRFIKDNYAEVSVTDGFESLSPEQKSNV